MYFNNLSDVKRTCSWNFYRIQVWTLSSSFKKKTPKIPKTYRNIFWLKKSTSNHLQSSFVSSNQHLVFLKIIVAQQPDLTSPMTPLPRSAPPTWRKLLGTFHAKTLLPWHQKCNVKFFWGVVVAPKKQLFRFGGRLNSVFQTVMIMYACTYVCMYTCVKYAWTLNLLFHWHSHATCRTPIWNL